MGAALDRAGSQTQRRLRELDERTIKNFNAALVRSVQRFRDLLKKIADIDSGKIKPPKTYTTQSQIARWRKEYVNKAIHQSGIIEGMAKMLARAGAAAIEDIKQVLRDEYAEQYLAAGADIADGAQRASVGISFAQLDERQLDIIMGKDANRPFSKIAFSAVEDERALEKAIQDTMFQAALRGESQADIVRRLRKITGYQAYRCRRIAQTEHTRIQSQARYQAGNKAKQKGVGVYNTWSTRMINSRDSHISLNGKTALQGEPFTTSLGNKLLFPGDPSAPAEEVINCHCVLVPDVLLPGENLETLNFPGDFGLNINLEKAFL